MIRSKASMRREKRRLLAAIGLMVIAFAMAIPVAAMLGHSLAGYYR